MYPGGGGLSEPGEEAGESGGLISAGVFRQRSGPATLAVSDGIHVGEVVASCDVTVVCARASASIIVSTWAVWLVSKWRGSRCRPLPCHSSMTQVTV
ncbi:hypothetical protein NDU88_007325 [Pleurodeles waltl]|uniref:Uncharacterized protein n=1 Tax=Pleurodeles waltl TaxID=8319 RepID=A0AAV7VPE8_PLEWA|nr:hypothetical protein NDU88_007325 [Pleurodeles waltl]